MKARVKATGEIIEVKEVTKYSSNYAPSTVYEDVTDGVIYKKEFLDFENVTDVFIDVKEKSLPKDEPDYWEKLKHQYAGQFLQGMIIGKPFTRDYVKDAYDYATALVNRFKEESQCLET